ncbi:hypothetical protein DICVIV_07197 [Dictyocaulus viviparus]|uniref:CIP2A N-terminal domain-containing protein n=1 Tax=Dictyocaulus viviparus TaxID=29172 RepID=A0A0D8XSN1_DICVI|nr:hypothetical protein DICVIV_07197 [Dictyocaulus viviparus]
MELSQLEALYNVRIRRYLCSELHLCESVFDCLKLSLREQLGPQNLIDILRLLQTSYKTFSKRIIKLLSHDSRIVVVSSLVLVGYLEEKVRDMVYCSQNIRETFQCVFNVLIMGDKDCLMTRHIASDFLRRLVVSETNTISPTPVITSTGKDIMNYEFFDRCIQQTAELLIVLDPRMEECIKAKIECGERVSDVISVDQLLTIIDTSVKTTLETSKQHVIYQCRRILEGLRLAEVCSSEEDLRFRLLEVTTAALCAHILESQYITNPVLIFIEKPLSQRTEKIADWSIYGVAVVLVLLKLLASLKDFSKLHKDQYWNSLKDTRLVSFLAYSLVYGDSEMINNALVLYSYCSQLHAFPNRW